MSNKIDIIINAVDKASATLKKVEGSINNVSGASQDAEQDSASFGGGLMSLVPEAAMVVGALVAVGAAAKEAFEFGKEGAATERIETSFNNLAKSYGVNADYMLDSVRKATLGTISDADLIQSANRAMMLGVTSDTEKMINLYQIAAFRARAMGITTTQAANDIMTGIGRASPLILDNLGIITKGHDIYGDFARSIGKTADELTGAEQKAALTNFVLEEGNKQLKDAGGLAMDDAGKFEHLSATWKNSTNTMKEKFAPAVADVAETMATLIERSADAEESTSKWYLVFPPLYDAILAVKTLTPELSKKQREAAEAVSSADHAMLNYATSIRDVNAASSESIPPTDELVSKFGGILKITQDVGREMETYNDKQDDLAEKDIELQEQIANATLQYGAESEEVATLNQKLAENRQKMAENTADFEMNTNRRILKRAEEILSADGLTTSEEKALLAKGLAMGVYTQEYVEQAQKVIDESQKIADGINGIPANASSTVTITTIFDEIKRGGGGVGHATGTDGWLTVPQGYPNDSYTVGLTSGETYAVIPAGNSGVNSAANVTSSPVLGGATGGNINVTLVYSPAVSLGNREEAENVLIPMIERGIRSQKSNELL